MKRLFVIIVLVLLILNFAQFNVIAYQQDEIMTIAEVQVGMKGIGKTVISGLTVEEFDVDILGILKDRGQGTDLILVQVSGPVIEKTGGIAEGMSGSPVYVDGKLIGAIGYGWGLTDHTIGMVTPIESMLKVFDLDKHLLKKVKPIQIDLRHNDPEKSSLYSSGKRDKWTEVELSDPINLGSREIKQINFCKSFEVAYNGNFANDTLVAYPVNTPLQVSGLTGRALERLMQDLERFDFIPVKTGGGSLSGDQKYTVEPGSAIAVQLVRGDINVSAIGTLTYIKDNKILAFGHPFLSLGDVEYFLSGAKILTVIDQLNMPFKLGVPLEPIGVITQDRNAAIGGRIDRLPKIIPFNINIYDLDVDKMQEIQFQVIRDEELLVSLAINSILQTIDIAIDRKGFGTSTMYLQIIGDNLPDRMVSFSNMYYSGSDIAANSLNDIYNILSMIVNNPFKKVNLASISVDIQVARQRQMAIIEEVKLLNDQLKPGDTADVQVTFRPFRDELFTKIFKVPIPENIQTGEASLTVSGGIYGAYSDMETSVLETNQTDQVIAEHYKHLNELLDVYLKQPKNNDLVIEIIPYYIDVLETVDSMDESDEVVVSETEKERLDSDSLELQMQIELSHSEESESTSSDKEEISQFISEIFNTDYVLEGSLTLEITIMQSTFIENEESTEVYLPLENQKKEN
ncbi:MAG: SpoIVB peptidase S55 [Halanaerobiales bacterium]|nr:SpoIVB peptidase S55 [Halanaerobiales bacterium]